MTKQLVLVLDNIRSTHNVGSILRTADGFGVSKVYLCGITPYPKQAKDERLPYLAEKIDKQINKTALGAEKSVTWEYASSCLQVLEQLKSQGFALAALEQTKDSQDLSRFEPPDHLSLVVGNEIDGVSQETLNLCETHLEIPMHGHKESFNVAVSAGIALYALSRH